MQSTEYHTTDVYRLYGGDIEEGLELLYVGISWDARVRWSSHRRGPFWDQVTYATVNTFASRWAAEVMEAHAIANEYPRYNVDPGSRRGRYGSFDEAMRQERDYYETHIGWSNAQWIERAAA